ncbi:MAG: hypothetical protein QG673_2288 [Pseudomonadota bacterium]|jgi:hypothetical protein|nr:hypothetical protein [Pseudomonadota bacterium]
MAKINEQMFENATQTAGLKNNTDNNETQKYVAVYDVPKKWIHAVKTKSGIRTMSAYARQAILEKLERDGII